MFPHLLPRRIVLAAAGLIAFAGCTGSTPGVPGGEGGSGDGTGGAATPGGSGGSNGGAGNPGGTVGGRGGTGAGTGGAAGGGGVNPGLGGMTTTGAGGAGGTTVGPLPALDCGPLGTAIVNAGPPRNRVNYVILADGYTATTVNTTLMTHINNAMTERFSPELGQPYLRYKNFVNICLFKTVSQTDGIGNGSTIFSCTGNDTSRLAQCSTTVAQQQLTANTPAGMTVDWHSIVLNGTSWWNTGSVWMLWSGGNANGPKAALHEGGHGFHQLADEYCASSVGSACSTANGTASDTTEYAEVNSTANMTTSAGKWDLWMGTMQKGMASPDVGATGMQGAFRGSRYADLGQFRPSANSKMNSLFISRTDTVNTSYNAVSREKIVMDIWRRLVPVDSTTPPAGAVAGATTLTVNVIDPAVISVDWSVDGTLKAANGGTTFNVAGQGLAAGSHTITAKAYDNATTDLVRYRTGQCLTPPPSTNPRDKDPCWGRAAWPRSQQTITWTVTVP